MSRLQVRDPDTGVWHDVSEVRDVSFGREASTFREAPVEPVETRQQWTLDLHIQGQAFGQSLHDAIVQAERQAFVDRCARRLWLRHSYRLRGAH